MRLQITNLSSGYRQTPVIHDISCQLAAGEIVGLIGLNGAGKSTLLKTILGLLPPLSGTITLDGQTMGDNQQAYATHIAYIPETPILYDELTLAEHIQMTALGYGLDPQLVWQRAEPLLKRFRLDAMLHWLPKHFSKGMKQKVMIICALITDAKLLVIDEPFLGLDPLAIQDLVSVLTERAQQGVSILFTTHVLTLSEQFCERFLLLSAGRLVGDGTLTALRHQFNLPNASLEDIYFAMIEKEQSLSSRAQEAEPS